MDSCRCDSGRCKLNTTRPGLGSKADFAVEKGVSAMDKLESQPVFVWRRRGGSRCRKIALVVARVLDGRWQPDRHVCAIDGGSCGGSNLAGALLMETLWR
jgi:hypothetical protein